MKLKNTEHLINSVRLTVFCLKEDDRLLLDKLLSALNSDSNVCASIINLDEKAAVETDVALNKNKFTIYASCINELIPSVERSNAHLIATVSVEKYSDWRSIHFKVAEELKDKVCFVRLITNQDNSDIRLQIESGENAWQYIPYCLDEKGNLCETN